MRAISRPLRSNPNDLPSPLARSAGTNSMLVSSAIAESISVPPEDCHKKPDPPWRRSGMSLSRIYAVETTDEHRCTRIMRGQKKKGGQLFHSLFGENDMRLLKTTVALAHLCLIRVHPWLN